VDLYAAAFSVWGSPVTWLELVAFVLSVTMVVLNIRVDARAWPLAIAASALYGLLFLHSRLYGETALQGLFIGVALWGWWQWLRGREADGTALHVRHLTPRASAALAAATLAAWPLLGAFLDRATDTDVPYWDAFPTAASIAGQWLLGRKYVENWPAWIVVNLVSVGLFAYKGLWLTVLLYALFAALAAAGWRAWRRLAAGAAA
jgi:nicotinamide mononucleotide transporter